MNWFERAKTIPHGIRVLTEWIGEGGVCVDSHKAQERAKVCLTCPLNQDGWAFTEGVAKVIRAHVRVKNHLAMRVKGEKSLKTCAACGCWIPLKLWLPKEKLLGEVSNEEMKRYVSNCWLRTERE